MNKHEFLERVNSIREKKGWRVLKWDDITPEDYAKVQYVYTWHPAFDIPDAKQEIAEIYTIQRATVNGMFIINSLIPAAKTAEVIERDRFKLRAQISELEAKLNKLNGIMHKIAEGENVVYPVEKS